MLNKNNLLKKTNTIEFMNSKLIEQKMIKITCLNMSSF